MKEQENYYKILGVSRDATKNDIQKAFRKLARKYHPDINIDDGAEEMFKHLNEAHSTLVDPESRKLYDLYGPDWKNVQFQQQNNEAGKEQWDEFYRDSDFGDGTDYFSKNAFSDFFANVFGQKSRQEYSQETLRGNMGGTIEAEIELSLDELVQGASKIITWSSVQRVGSSFQPTEEKVQIKIPKGLRDGSVVRLAGKGGSINSAGEKGDLLLRIKTLPDKRFSLQGYDLVTVIPLAPWEAALGTQVEIETLFGFINLTIPKGCQSGKKLRVSGKGLPKKNGEKGDLFVEIVIHVPDVLTGEEEKLFQKLMKSSSFQPRKRKGQHAAGVYAAA